MTKILFINHTYHKKTQSSNFIVDLLLKNKANTVNIASINPYAKNKESELLKFQNTFFDIIILWQLINQPLKGLYLELKLLSQITRVMVLTTALPCNINFI